MMQLLQSILPRVTPIGTVLGIVAMLAMVPVAMVPVALAQGPGGNNAKAPEKPAPIPLIKWKPGEKLGWDNFKGGMPRDATKHAETSSTIEALGPCKWETGEYDVQVYAVFSQLNSTTDPDKQTPKLLAHEQLHFDIEQKHAFALKEKWEEIYKARCKCNMSAEDMRALRQAREAARAEVMAAADAEQKLYDSETEDGTNAEKQTEWSERIASEIQAASAKAGAPDAVTPDAGAPKADAPKAADEKAGTPKNGRNKSAPKTAAPSKTPKSEKSADDGKSSFNPAAGNKVASAPITGRGGNCPPPEQGFIPGWPGRQFSEQYASVIPGSNIPGEFISFSVPFAADGGAYCTFGEGTAVPGRVVSTGEDGSSVPPSASGGADRGGTPPGPDMRIARGDPVRPQDPPGKTPDAPRTSRGPAETPTAVANPVPSPKETPKAVETPTPVTPADAPKAPEQPPPTQTTDKPPDIPKAPDEPTVIIFIKASEAVLDGSQPGEPIHGQLVKLVLKEKPALPTTTASRTAVDKGFDKPAPQCTTGADGQCKFDIPAEERSLYALKDPPRNTGKPLNNYRLEFNAMKHTGGVAETTGKQVPNISATTIEGDITAEIFRIGDRNFVRLGVNTSSSVATELLEKFGPLLGVPIEADICLIKEPGPPLGSEPVSVPFLNQELPHAAIRLRTPIRTTVRR